MAACHRQTAVGNLAFMFFFLTKDCARALFVTSAASVGKEHLQELSLRCHHLLSDGEHVKLVTWSRVTSGNVSVLFRKFLLSGRYDDFKFYDLWMSKGASHDTNTLADISLPASNVTRNEAGLYRCEVTSDMMSVYDDVEVTILYGPGSPLKIASASGKFQAIEGDNITLTCETSCLPSCSFRWTCSGCMASKESTLTITNIRRGQAGVYTCTAYNVVSRVRTDAILDVTYPAEIKELGFANGTSSLQVKERQLVSMKCLANGNPAPNNITWSASGHLMSLNTTYQMSSYGRDVSSVVMIPFASCQDNDNYTCQTANDIGDPDMQSLSLRVMCPPIPDVLACHQDNFIQVALFLQSINLTSCVRARPRPYVTWQRCADEVMNQTLNEFYVTYDDVRAILSTVLVVYVRSPETYGNYRVTFENEYGTLYQNFTLQAKQSPQPPFNLTLINMTATSACIAWVVGFNGGAEQTFLVLYTPTGDRDSLSTEVSVIKEEEVVASCEERLAPEMRYTVTVFAENVYGRSHATKITITTSRHDIFEPKGSTWVEFATPVAIGFFLALITCCSIGVCGMKIYTQQTEGRNIEALSNTQTSPTEMPIYHSATNRTHLPIESREYEDLPSTENIYLTVLGDTDTYVDPEETLQKKQETDIETYDSLQGERVSANEYDELITDKQYVVMTKSTSQECDVDTSSARDEEGTNANYDDAWSTESWLHSRSVTCSDSTSACMHGEEASARLKSDVGSTYSCSGHLAESDVENARYGVHGDVVRETMLENGQVPNEEDIYYEIQDVPPDAGGDNEAPQLDFVSMI